MIGKNIGWYRVLAKLGEGGMGEVYRALDTRLGRRRQETGQDLMLLPLAPGPGGGWTAGTSTTVLTSAANEVDGEFSPDAKWLACTSDETGRSEVYVQPFSGPGGPVAGFDGRSRVGRVAGERSASVWSVRRSRHGCSCRIAGRTFEAAKPRVRMRIPSGVSWMDPAPDSTRAAVIRSEDPRRESMVLIVNFFDRLRREVR